MWKPNPAKKSFRYFLILSAEVREDAQAAPHRFSTIAHAVAKPRSCPENHAGFQKSADFLIWSASLPVINLVRLPAHGWVD